MTLLLAFVLLVVVFGGFVVAAVLSTPAGPPVDVAGVVRVSPLSGWEVASRFVEPPLVRLTRGSGSLDVTARSFEGDAEELARRYVAEVLEPQADRLSVSRTFEPVRFASGLEGVRVPYVGRFGRSQTPIEGEVTAVVSPSGVGVVFDAWAPEGVLRYAAGDTRTMIERARIA